MTTQKIVPYIPWSQGSSALSSDSRSWIPMSWCGYFRRIPENRPIHAGYQASYVLFFQAVLWLCNITNLVWAHCSGCCSASNEGIGRAWHSWLDHSQDPRTLAPKTCPLSTVRQYLQFVDDHMQTNIHLSPQLTGLLVNILLSSGKFVTVWIVQ